MTLILWASVDVNDTGATARKPSPVHALSGPSSKTPREATRLHAVQGNACTALPRMHTVTTSAIGSATADGGWHGGGTSSAINGATSTARTNSGASTPPSVTRATTATTIAGPVH